MIDAREITKALPPFRDDEPASLRQEIADEILDHLKCALRRELLVCNGDEACARQHVLNRFGDPRQIARKLWFQAMRSKTMTQRILIGSAIFSMAVSALLVGMVSWMMHLQHQANAALIEQVGKLIPERTTAAPPRDAHWNNLKVQVTIGARNGPAAEGFSIVVSKLPGIGDVNQSGRSHQSLIGATGLDNCGYVEPGRFEVDVISPWGERATTQFTVFPGQDHVEHVVAPEKPPEPTKVVFNVEGLSDGVPPKHTLLFITVRRNGSRNVAGHTWNTRWWDNWTSKPVLLVVPNHGVWISDVPSAIWMGKSNLEIVQNTVWEKLDPTREWDIPADQYDLSFNVINNVPKSVSPDDLKWKDSLAPGTFPQSDEDLDHLWRKSDRPNVIAEPDKLNTWSITIPKEVTQYLGNQNRPSAMSNSPLKAEIERVRNRIDADVQNAIRVDRDMEKMVDEYNDLYRQQRFAEAVIVAKKAKELNPKDDIAATMVLKAQFAMQDKFITDLKAAKEDTEPKNNP